MTAAREGEIAMLGALEDLFSTLEREEVRFCHWKSNAHLAAAVQGATDLDLLVDRRDAGHFRRAIDEHDFKPLVAAPGKHYPAVENYLGFDPLTGRLIHLHVHYQLVLGQQFVKDYRLPIEDRILESVRDHHGVPVPAAEVELTILAMRVALKYRLRDAVKDAVGYGSPGVPNRIRDELHWLAGQTSQESVVNFAASVEEIPRVVGDILEVVLEGHRAGLRLLRLRQQLREDLRPFRRISRARSTWQYLSAIARKRSRSLGVGEKHRMTLRNGGITIGFVGADGAGKSTIIAAVNDWLSWRLDVSVAYMGTSHPTGATRVLKEFSGVARSADRRVGRLQEGGGAAGAAVHRLALSVMGLRRLAEARSKLARRTWAADATARGAIVLFDRFPLPDVTVLGRPMDGPRLQQEIGQVRSSLLRRMVDREAAVYHRLGNPERLIALKVSPDVSLVRKPDHDPIAIDAKSRAVDGLTGPPGSFAEIDADRPLEDVLAEVKATVWDWL